MDAFCYRDGELYAEDVPLAQIAASVGTPCYVYARSQLIAAYRTFEAALAGQEALVCYAVKANANLAILATFAALGAGFDIVSAGELERVVAAGGDPRRVVFSGVGKTGAEIERALAHDILCFNVESPAELDRLDAIAARMDKVARVSLRVNPDVDAGTHPYIATGLKENKFGIALAAARDLYRQAARYPHLQFMGVDCHIGSQLTELRPFADALDRVLPLVAELRAQGVPIRHVDVGGGLGIRYREERPPTVEAYVGQVREQLVAHGLADLALLFEPGRALVAAAGVLLTRVEYVKSTDTKHFAVIDAGMNDLIRPALYGAYQVIQTVRARADTPGLDYDVVGPVCESADVFGRSRHLRLQAGDLLVIRDAGAYGFAMASQYNARPRPAEVLVEGNRFAVVRTRETLADLWRGESLPGWEAPL